MRILIIGGGGREHALAWRCAQSERVTEVLVAPGNAGTETEPKCENVAVAAEDIQGMLAMAQERRVDLTIVGPEAPLVDGVVDVFTDAGLACFGPRAASARLEGSKAFAKDFMARHGIPTARYGNFTDIEAAEAFVDAMGAPVVVKADGLAAGKGVIVAQSTDEAKAAVRDMLAGNAFGQAGHRVVVEEFLVGEEASFIVMVDGEHVLPLATSQDHKARDAGDLGPNTGGMGAYSPAPVVDAVMHTRIMDQVIWPTVHGMEKDGSPYTGFLYAGIMATADGPKVLEFNCRFGDPETQPIMMRLSSDLVELCEAALAGRLHDEDAEWDPRAALGVVLAAEGYPGSYAKGRAIRGLGGLDSAGDGQKVFHAGTRREGDQVVNTGGRVLCAVALGDDIAAAQARAYELIDKLELKGSFCRRDIGWRAI
jgi:phosphoribosylamine---glycine ligase